MTPTSESSVLEAIVAATRKIVADRRGSTPVSVLEQAARDRPAPRDFAAALTAERMRPGARMHVIAECKRRSPSRGILRRQYDAPAIARGYEAAGAAAISVLTEPTFFDGAIADLEAVRDAVSVPVLRKDFMVDAYQLVEARAHGADAILLIVAALSKEALATLASRAKETGLAVLVEVHDEPELEAALAAGAEIIGVNNRNLNTLEVDVEAAARLVELIPDEAVAVAESGLKTHEDLRRLGAMGFDAFLVGEQLMTAADPAAALGALLCA